MSKEKLFLESEILLSTTDLNSHIKYANSNFCDISGFTLDEMVGKPHNIVRHADMPKVAFKDLWSFLQRGESWMGPVKNKCENGDYYWVNAFVTPIKNENGKTHEYQSIRTALSPNVKARAEKTYPLLSKGKTPNILKVQTDITLWIFMSLLLLTLISGYLLLEDLNNKLTMIPIFIVSILSTLLQFIWRQQYKIVVNEAKEVFDNPLMSYLYSGNTDKIGNISLSLKMRKAQLNAIVGRVSDDSIMITEKARDSSNRGGKVSSVLQEQKIETAQVAAAINEMSVTIQEIAKVVIVASEASQQGLKMTNNGHDVVNSTITSIKGLSSQLAEVDTAIARLTEGTQSIEKVLSEISSIADQTNLLALNAAIEAARAGEQGRGFAVVADEVRALAMRTQQSTDEIGKLLGYLKNESDFATKAMSKGNELSSNCVLLSQKTGDSLNKITDEVSSIADITTQISRAIEEQSVAAEQINKSITTISNMSHESEIHGLEAAKLGDSLLKRLSEQQNLVFQFKC
jgi:methyl-accepting chemotaxis protein